MSLFMAINNFLTIADNNINSTLTTFSTLFSNKITINVGLVTPGRLILSNIMGYSYVASASTMAIQEAKNRGYLQNIDIK